MIRTIVPMYDVSKDFQGNDKPAFQVIVYGLSPEEVKANQAAILARVNQKFPFCIPALNSLSEIGDVKSKPRINKMMRRR